MILRTRKAEDKTMPTISTLPRIIRFTGMTDSGPTDGGRDCSACPHCGSKGRYTFWFLTEDGQTGGAMSGCVKLFPVSRIALVHKALIEKQHKLQRDHGHPGSTTPWKANLNKSDQKKLDAVEGFYAGEITEDDALRSIDRAAAEMAAWMRAKYGR